MNTEQQQSRQQEMVARLEDLARLARLTSQDIEAFTDKVVDDISQMLVNYLFPGGPTTNRNSP